LSTERSLASGGPLTGDLHENPMISEDKQ
jgi:hypothetical protein